MNISSNPLVLGATGQVGKLGAKYLKRSKANFSVGSRRKENLKEFADQFGASRFITSGLIDQGFALRKHVHRMASYRSR